MHNNNRTSSRWTFVDPSYADLPRPIQWILNTFGAVGMVLPFLTVLLPCFALVWGVDQLQSVFDVSPFGVVSTLMSMIKTGVMVCSVEMLRITYSIRHDWEDELRRIIHEACDEFLQPWQR